MEVNKKKIGNDIIEQIIADIRLKKDMTNLGTEFITDNLKEILRLNKKLLEQFTTTPLEKIIKSSTYKQVIKDIRAKARKGYAMFVVPNLITDRKELLEKSSLSNSKAIQTLLESHVSTKERLPIYPEFFDTVTDIPANTVLDLACGLNPIAFFHFANPKAKYVCNELSDKDCEQLNTFFANNKLNATAIPFDVTKYPDRLTHNPFNQQFDYCFLLKTLDTLEAQRKYCTYDILPQINAKRIIATFPIKNLKGRQMDRSPKINWFEKMLARMNYIYTVIILGNEVIYVIKKDVA